MKIAKRIFAVFFLVIIISSFFIISVEAEIYLCPICGIEHNTDDLGTIGKIAYDYNDVVYNGNLFEKGEGEELDVKDVLAFDTTARFKTLWETGKGIYDILLPIGYVLVIVFAILGLLSSYTSGVLTLEAFLKFALKMMLGIAILSNGYDLITLGVQICNAVFNAIYDADLSVAFTSGTECIYTKIKDLLPHEQLGKIFELLIPYIILSLAKLVVKATVWMRIFMILALLIFAPIGMADIAAGLQGSGFRYFKKLLAAVLQGSVIVAIANGYSMITSIVLQSFSFSGWFVSVTLAFVVITLMIKSNGIANELIGG